MVDVNCKAIQLKKCLNCRFRYINNSHCWYELANEGKIDCVNISTIRALNSFLQKYTNIFWCRFVCKHIHTNKHKQEQKKTVVSIESIFSVHCSKWLLLRCEFLVVIWGLFIRMASAKQKRQTLTTATTIITACQKYNIVVPLQKLCPNTRV